MEAAHDPETGERHVGGICGAGKGFPNNDFDALRFVFVRKSFLLFLPKYEKQSNHIHAGC